ncbi:hypothetical protein [Shewanella sp.]|jgi:hypothetical protein|uniref:hypothetical protein n=1 Tax=Shewanella sp. TaxID=50422 RepID=UPI0040476A36
MIILSCGCQSDEFGIEAEWDTFSREGKPAIECGFICQKHFEIYDARTPEPESQRQWVGLTDEEIEKCIALANPVAIFEEVEAKLKEKNT